LETQKLTVLMDYDVGQVAAYAAKAAGLPAPAGKSTVARG
jgi:hypothetical protein